MNLRTAGDGGPYARGNVHHGESAQKCGVNFYIMLFISLLCEKEGYDKLNIGSRDCFNKNRKRTTI